jgi:hypothetical protein
MIEDIINNLNNELNLDLSIGKELDKKPTARSLEKYILKDKKNNKYLLEIARNSIEIFYFKRTIEHQEKFNKLKSDFKCNMPIFVKSGNKLSLALYKFYENPKFLQNDLPVLILKEFNKLNTEVIKINEENINKLLTNFLSTWPYQYHSMIKRQKEFRIYRQKLEELKTVEVCFEHGDFNGHNIMQVDGVNYLIDFEFSKDFQPVEFDIYDYYKLKGKNITDIKYYDLHKIRYELIDKINIKIDDDASIEIYQEIDDDAIIRDNWTKLYEKGANYNLSLTWCETWLKYFKKENQELFIFTIWNGDDLMLLAPLYKQKNQLSLIGTEPDLYDSFDILYEDTKYLKFFFYYIYKKKYQINFKYLDANSEVSKVLIKFLYQNKIQYNSEIIDTKPRTKIDSFKIKTKEKSDIKRCKNRAIKKFDKELKFEISINKDDNTLSDFINIHKKRWGGGPFVDISKYDDFIKDISSTDLVVISRLSVQDKTVAYHLAYQDSNNILNSAIPSYSNEYNDMSPGKVLLYEILNYSKDNGDKFFDFGRGAEEYKYWFSNDSTILFHIQIYKSDNILKKSQLFINKVFNKIYRMLYV